jgi:glycosyltransferase involved in cell wall biosynthesis
MSKIVIDARMINNSGIKTYLQNIIPNLIKNHELILLSREKETEDFPWISKVRTIDFNKPIYSISEQILSPVKIPKCDIFLSPHYNSPVLPIRAKKRVVIIHDVYHLAFNHQLSLIQKLYSKKMISFAANLSDHIITSSQFSKSEILKYLNINESKISVVHFGFNYDEYSNQAYNFEPVKMKYNLPEKFFLFVGNIKPHKNLYNLLKAFQIVLEKEINLKLVIVGEYKKLITSDKKSFKLLDENPLLKDNSVFTGFIDKEELVLLYKNTSALVFPSFYEGFGIPPIEAMACSCPVISSNAASLPEVCNDAAIYINPNNIDDIANKMIAIISDSNLTSQLIEKGKENIRRFSNEIFSNNFEKVLNNLF